MAAIFALSSLPSSALPSGYPGLGHLVEYAVLGALLTGALAIERDTTRAAVVAFLVAIAYGITDEFHQAFVPGRMPDVVDWIVDGAGALTGACAMAALIRRRRAQPRAYR